VILQVAVLCLAQLLALTKLLQLLQRLVERLAHFRLLILNGQALLVNSLLKLAACQIAPCGDEGTHRFLFPIDALFDLAQPLLDRVVQCGQVLTRSDRALGHQHGVRRRPGDAERFERRLAWYFSSCV